MIDFGIDWNALVQSEEIGRLAHSPPLYTAGSLLLSAAQLWEGPRVVGRMWPDRPTQKALKTRAWNLIQLARKSTSRALEWAGGDEEYLGSLLSRYYGSDTSHSFLLADDAWKGRDNEGAQYLVRGALTLVGVGLDQMRKLEHLSSTNNTGCEKQARRIEDDFVDTLLRAPYCTGLDEPLDEASICSLYNMSLFHMAAELSAVVERLASNADPDFQDYVEELYVKLVHDLPPISERPREITSEIGWFRIWWQAHQSQCRTAAQECYETFVSQSGLDSETRRALLAVRDMGYGCPYADSHVSEASVYRCGGVVTELLHLLSFRYDGGRVQIVRALAPAMLVEGRAT